jgi:hypothetical protein
MKLPILSRATFEVRANRLAPSARQAGGDLSRLAVASGRSYFFGFWRSARRRTA